MPTPKKAKPKFANPDFKGFVNISLTEELKATIKAQPFSSEVFEQELLKLTEFGWSVKFAADDYNHCYQCVLTQTLKEHKDYGCFLSGRGSTPAKAFKQMLYLFLNVCDGVLVDNLQPSTSEDYDD